MRRRLKDGRPFNDLLEQMGQMKKMGSLSKLVEMIPGANKVSDEELAKGEEQMKRTEAIILSMTPEERAKPALITPPRKRRIAAGSGTKVEDVNRLLRQLEETQKMVKKLGGLKKKKGRLPFGGMPPMPGV